MIQKKKKIIIVSERKNYSKNKTDKNLCYIVYRDVYGIPRLIETLHIHQWPNMNLKGRRNLF
jgi:hypothetical protein